MSELYPTSTLQIVKDLVDWLSGASQSPPDEMPVLVLVTDPRRETIQEWRLQTMREALGLVSALKKSESEGRS